MSSEADYTIYYWPIHFRAEYIKLIFIYKKVKYDLAGFQEVVALKNQEIDLSGNGANMFAPPMLHDRTIDAWIGQTPAIVSHLARQFDLLPEDSNQIWVAEKCLNDCQDICSELTRNNGSKMWEEYSDFEQFINGRFKRWLNILEANMTKYGSNGFFCGPKITFADLALCACLGNMERALGEKIGNKIKEFAPNVHTLVSNLMASSEICNHYKEVPQTPYCGGQIEASIRKMIEEMP